MSNNALLGENIRNKLLILLLPIVRNHIHTVTGQSSPEPKANAFVVDWKWVWDGFLDGHWETEATPVYNFNNVHVATMDSIRTHERPNHS